MLDDQNSQISEKVVEKEKYKKVKETLESGRGPM
jgi:hypothetical protein